MSQETKRRGQGILFLFNVVLISLISLTVCTPLRNTSKKARWLGGIQNDLPLIVILGEQQANRHLESYRFKDRTTKNRVGMLSRQKRFVPIFYSWDMFLNSEYKSYRYGYPQGANIFNIAPGNPGTIHGKNVWQYFAELVAKHARDGYGLSRLWDDMKRVWQHHKLYRVNIGVFNSENMVISYLFD